MVMTQTLQATSNTASPDTGTLSVKDAIETRRSIRSFEQEPLNQDDLREILRLTGLAPSANNVQTWRFAVVQNKELQAKLQGRLDQQSAELDTAQQQVCRPLSQ